jgi:hypothetical protein
VKPVDCVKHWIRYLYSLNFKASGELWLLAIGRVPHGWLYYF